MAGYRRFSLRTLVIVMTAFTLWIGYASYRANRQRRAVEGLQTRGAQFEYAHEFIFDASCGPLPQRHVPNAPPPGPGWLRGFVGDHYFINPVKLRISDQNWDNADHLALLENLPDMESIYLFRVRLRNSDTAHFRRAKNLKVLMLGTWAMPSDEPLQDFEFLSDLPNLVHLSVNSLPFDDDDAACLQSLPSLRWLQVGKTQLTDDGLAKLRHVPHLKYLVLNDTRITDQGVRNIVNCPGLEMLSLSDTDVTDECVPYLTQLKHIHTLTIGGTEISEEGIAKLRKAFPNANIDAK